MRDNPLTFSLPRWHLTRWLTDAGYDVPQDIRVALVGSLYGTLPIFLGGVVNTVTVSALIAYRIPEPHFLFWFVLEVVICATRLVVLVAARRAAAAERPTPTDLNLVLAVAWAASLGFGCLISLASGDWTAATLACISAAGMVGGTCFRNFAAPRLTAVMIGLTLGPVCIGAAVAGEALFFVTFAQIPIYLVTMTAAAYRLNRMMVATMRAERENGFRAHHDGLTGLSNRFGLNAAMAALQARGSATGLLYLDLDGFKAVNDGLGHEAGDRLLRMVAERLDGAIERSEIAARIGGDEFVVLCPDRTRAGLIGLGERLIATLSQPYALGPEEARVGVSIGIAATPDHGDDLTGLLRAADLALYRSKALGKGRCTLASRQGRAREKPTPERLSA